MLRRRLLDSSPYEVVKYVEAYDNHAIRIKGFHIFANSNCGIEMDFQDTSLKTNNNLFCVFSDVNHTEAWIYDTGYLGVRLFNVGTVKSSNKLPKVSTNRFTFKAMAKPETSSTTRVTIDVNDKTYYNSVINNSSIDYLTFGDVTLLMKNYHIRGKLYAAKLYSNGKVVVDLIPVLRKKDKVAGMLDKINNTFYPPGTFDLGTRFGYERMNGEYVKPK